MKEELNYKVGDTVYYEDYEDEERSGFFKITRAYISEYDEKLYDIESLENPDFKGFDIFEEELTDN